MISDQVETLHETDLAVQAILDLPDIQWMYHSELKERLPIKILSSPLIDKNIELTKFGQEVRLLSDIELEKEGIDDYVEFHNLEFHGDTLLFKLSYQIEGLGATGKLIKENGDWKVVDYSAWEN